jgi:hypothetical protein
MIAWTWRRALVVVGLCGSVALTAGVWLLWRQPAIPSSIKRQVNFEIFVPNKVDRKSVSYDTRLQLLTFKDIVGGNTVFFTEQATPDVIASSPNMLSNGFGTLKHETALATPFGTAYVGNNQALNGQQTLGMNAQGTLLFVRPTENLTQSQWHQLFQSLTVIK